jgi:hypothetical protein
MQLETKIRTAFKVIQTVGLAPLEHDGSRTFSYAASKAAAEKILDLLQGCTPEDLAEIREEIKAHQM